MERCLSQKVNMEAVSRLLNLLSPGFGSGGVSEEWRNLEDGFHRILLVSVTDPHADGGHMVPSLSFVKFLRNSS